MSLQNSSQPTEQLHNPSKEAKIHTAGSSIKSMALTSFSKVKWFTGIGAGPTPFSWTRSPQKGWSPKKGMIVVGHCRHRNVNILPTFWWQLYSRNNNGQYYISMNLQYLIAAGTNNHGQTSDFSRYSSITQVRNVPGFKGKLRYYNTSQHNQAYGQMIRVRSTGKYKDHSFLFAFKA